MSIAPTITSSLSISHVIGNTFTYELIADKGIRIEWDLSSVDGISTVDGNDRLLTGYNLALGSYSIPVKAINYYGEDSQVLQLSVVEDIVNDSPAVNETVDLFIISGQSNAHGWADVNSLQESQKVQDGLFFGSWHQFPNNASTEQYYSAIETSVTAGMTRSEQFSSVLGSSKFGPEIGFTARANETNLTPNKIGILKYAVDGTGISLWTNNGICWQGLQSAIAEGVSQYETAGYTVNFKGMIWNQGENGTDANSLNAFISSVRSLLGTTYGVANSNEFPIIITGQNPGWGNGLEVNVADLDANVGYVETRDHGQINVEVNGGLVYNLHPGSGEFGVPTDVNGSGNNDMYDIGMAYADEMSVLFNGVVTPTTYTITFVNVDDSTTTQIVEEGVTPTPPTGVDTPTRTFTSWPPITPAANDVTYTAGYDEVAQPNTFVITFVNVDDSTTTQIVEEGLVATPPTGVNTSTRTFTGWPTIAPATSDVIYTATYTINEGNGDAWTPAQLGTAYWWDASDATTITQSGGSVSDWTDKNQVESVYQTSSHIMPKTENSTINGLNVLDFDGNDFFRGPVLSFGDFSKFIVFSRNTHAANNNLLSNVGGNADALWSSGTDKIRMYEGGYQIVAPTPINVNQAYICGSTKAASGEIELFLDGNSEITGTSTLGTGPNQMQIGSFLDANNLNGKIAEIVLLPTVATLEERQKIEGYLANKWGITLPAGHPYETTEPTI